MTNEAAIKNNNTSEQVEGSEEEPNVKPGKIFEKIANITEEIEAIGKNRRNKEQKYQFRSIDDVYNTVHPLMSKNRVFCVPKVLDIKREERSTRSGGVLITTIQTIRFRYYTDDGSYVDCVLKGEGMDTGDKSTNKSITGAHKYSLLVMFSIPTDDIRDPDYETPEKNGVQPEEEKDWLDRNTQEWKDAEKDVKSGEIEPKQLRDDYKVSNKDMKHFEKLKNKRDQSANLSDEAKQKLNKLIGILPDDHPCKEVDLNGLSVKKFHKLKEFLVLYKDVRKGIGQMNEADRLDEETFQKMVDRLHEAKRIVDLEIIIDDMSLIEEDPDTTGKEDGKKLYDKPDKKDGRDWDQMSRIHELGKQVHGEDWYREQNLYAENQDEEAEALSDLDDDQLKAIYKILKSKAEDS